jgi:organic radical activating enzyme
MPEKKIDFEEGKKLPLVEKFYSLQGEGFHTGKAAFFIRVGGCDIACHWCDSKISWNPEIHPVIKTDDIVKEAAGYPAKAVVVTGGEPLMYPLDFLCKELKKQGIETFIETSGSHELSGIWDWICLSPKQQAPPLPGIFAMADELKIIVSHEEDFAWAEENAAKVRETCRLYLQPEWSRYKEMILPITEYIKAYPKWQVSLQSHKFMRIP